MVPESCGSSSEPLLTAANFPRFRANPNQRVIYPALFGAIALFFNALDLDPGIYSYRTQAGKIISGTGLHFLKDTDFIITTHARMIITAITFRVEDQGSEERWIETLTIQALQHKSVPSSPPILTQLQTLETSACAIDDPIAADGITYTHYRQQDFWRESFQQLEEEVHTLEQALERLSRQRELQYLKTWVTGDQSHRVTQ
ncbi:MAG: hypothetical protein VKJ24_07170 [Synechococcales bacterium]|nr:hypothetical protein [Synechococcales bacterium]